MAQMNMTPPTTPPMMGTIGIAADAVLVAEVGERVGEKVGGKMTGSAVEDEEIQVADDVAVAPK